MLRVILSLFLFSSLCAFGQIQSADVNQKHPENELKADLQFLRNKLEKKHPGLYRYTPKPAFDLFFDSLKNSIAQPMSEQEFLSLITLLNAKIGDGHTMLLPSQTATDYNNSTGKFLPFSLAYINDRLYIVENCSSDASIEKGQEIVSINGVETAVVMSKLMTRQIRDGFNQTYPTWILNHYVSAYYSFVYGQPLLFSLELRNTTGELHKKQVAALTKDSIKFFRQARYPTVGHTGVALEKNKDRVTAILTIKSFDTDLLSSLYNQDYNQVIDSIFALLKHDRITNLILDLRNNQGGDFETGRYLLSYLLLNPTHYLQSGKEARLIRPKINHFTGKLFVLINGGCFSNTAIVSACLERDQRAAFVGEETGGNKHVISGQAMEIVLPKTQIRGFISTATFQIIPGAGDGHGVLPTHPVLPAITDVLMGKDRAMELALKLISEQK